MSILRLTKFLMAREMLKAGFATRIINIETGLTTKQIRKLRGDVLREGHRVEGKSKTIVSASTTIRSREDQLAASVFVLAYETMGGERVEEGRPGVDISVLNIAYVIYRDWLERMRESRASFNHTQFDLNAAYGLAIDYRDMNGFMEQCSEKTCGQVYYLSATNGYEIDGCPFCHMERIAARKIAKFEASEMEETEVDQTDADCAHEEEPAIP